jgi:outer membrane protein OmpA-like peptidoglycan-associated protein
MSKYILAITLVATSVSVISQPLKSPTSREIEMGFSESSTRSIPSQSRSIPIQSTRNPILPSKSVELLIQFQFDSAELSSQGKTDIEQLAIALNSQSLKNSNFLIEGHTDQVGSSDYNMDLSLKRAQAVIRALVQLGISSHRLSPVGYGATRLYNQEQPEASENRRVRVVMK